MVWYYTWRYNYFTKEIVCFMSKHKTFTAAIKAMKKILRDPGLLHAKEFYISGASLPIKQLMSLGSLDVGDYPEWSDFEKHSTVFHRREP
jgi:hypothetical protein